MRTPDVMLALILDMAKKDENVRLVGMNGSRANPAVLKDRFQDFDIVYVVRDMKPFLENREWIHALGELVILQTPEEMTLFPPSLDGWFTFLMQFTDGNRIDLMLIPLLDLEKYLRADSQTVILLDKDHVAGHIPPPSDKKYWVKIPSEQEYIDCCNEFWWLVLYVDKGIRRKELLYASAHLKNGIWNELLRMLSWKAGIVHGFIFSPGKEYKYIKQYISSDEWNQLCLIMNTGSIELCAGALEIAIRLFSDVSKIVAEKLDFFYPDYEEKVLKYRRKLEEA